jgi:deoxycytidine triphosphate deaminase
MLHREMYLSDRDIKDLLPALGIEASHPKHPFDPEGQIQPASIDLRLSDTFWKPSRRRNTLRSPLARHRPAVDLRESHMQELDPRRDWRPVKLDEGDTLTIRPGHVLMGRVYERFAVPQLYAGKLEGRSSYARLGLFVHCTGDFINPGWAGFMPLQLFNCGPYPIRITPYLPICQLKLVRLSSEPERAYGEGDLDSKYVNDDGGPSFWWRDRQVRALQERLGEVHAPARLQREVLDIVRFEDPELLARFQEFVRRQRVGTLENADSLLSSFSRQETRRRRFDRASMAALPIFAGGTIGSVFVRPVSTWHVILWVLTVASVGLCLRGLARTDTDYLDRHALLTARARPRPADPA